MKGIDKFKQTYVVEGVHCLNCDWNKDEDGHGQKVEIPKGISIPAYECPNCGCAKLWKDKR